MPEKKRLDHLLVARALATTLKEAQAIIGAGEVLVDGKSADKAGFLYPVESTIERRRRRKFVSRAGDKLSAALTAFTIDPVDFTCIDVGCSTGGFTDCLLKQGASRIYSVDVGYGVLDWKLRQDDRVVVLERTNARYLKPEMIPDSIDLAVIDVSFISLRTLLQPLLPLFLGPIRIVALVKPQFELPRNKIPKGGVVKDGKLHDEALELVKNFADSLGLMVKGEISSPVLGTKGNQEFFLYLVDG